jgi:predicted amidohydrolase
MRVAVTQFATLPTLEQNLASCIHTINEAAACKPCLIVLPAFCNTLFCYAVPTYADHNQAWAEALTIDGEFLQEIAQQAKLHSCYIVLNASIRRDLTRDHQDGAIKSNISVTSCLFSPLGALIHQENKQRLTGYESEFFSSGDINSSDKCHKVITSPCGEIAPLAGDDSASFEAARVLALKGVKLICNSLNSFALDQSDYVDSARACENNVFYATANKIGPLIAETTLSNYAQVHEVIDQDSLTNSLVGVGQSQIIAPNGKVLAKLAHNEAGYTFADIDFTLAKAGLNNKCRPDGTEIMQQRRAELYNETILDKQFAALEIKSADHQVIPETTNVAIFATYKSNEQAIEDVCHYIENNLSDIIQLPELFFISDKAITQDADKRAEIADLSTELIKQISAVLRPFQYVCTSLIIDGSHYAVIISEHGLFAKQPQLHFCKRYQWTELGEHLKIIELPLEQGHLNLAMLTGDDANIPEIVKLAAVNDIHLLLVPFDIQEPSDAEFSFISHAAEYRICVVAASREKSFSAALPHDSNNAAIKGKVKTKKSTGLIVNLGTKAALIAQLQTAKFDGYINKPILKHQHGKITKALIHPLATCDKDIIGFN